MLGILILLFLVFVVALVASFVTPNGDNKRISRYAALGVAIVTVIVIGFNSYIIIPPGNIGVPVLFGTVENQQLGNGLHIINPFYSMEKMDVRLQEYTMSKIKDEGKKDGDDAIVVLSSDGMEIKLETTVWWRLDPSKSAEVFVNIGHGYEEKIVRPSVRSILRDISVSLSATDIYSTKRVEFAANVTKGLEEIFLSKGLILERFLLRDVELPKTVKEAIDEKIASEQRAQQMVYTLQKEKQEAERKRIEAQGIQDFQKIVSQGINKDLLLWKGLEVAKELAHSPNAKLIVLGDKSGLPFLLNGSSF